MQLSSRCWGVIPAAGTGSRMGSRLPKQFLEVAGATILEHSLAALLSCEFIETVVVVLSPGDTHAAQLPGLSDPRVMLATGGAQRSDSVLAGIEALAGMASSQDWVLVHDAARPCVSKQDIYALAQQVNERGVGGILAEQIVDTIKRSTTDGLVLETLPRESLWRAQTPQMFQYGLLGEALESARAKGLLITDEASAMEIAEQAVQLVAGSSSNLKITVAQDLPLAEYYLAQLRVDNTL